MISRDQVQFIKRLLAITILIASTLFLAFTVYTNWKELRGYQWEFNYSYLLLAAFALLIAFFSNVLGWGLIVEHLGGPSDFAKNAEIYCIAAHGKRLPGSFWYVAGRAYLYEKEAVPAAIILQGSLWEITFQLLSGLIIYGMFLPLYREIRYASFNHYLLLITIPLLLLILSPSIFRMLLRHLSRGQREIKISQVHWHNKALWLFIYLLGWLAGGGILYFLTGSVSSISLDFLPACWGFVALSGVVSTLAFFLPGGIGVREISLSLLLSSYVPLSVAIMLALLFRVWTLVGETILLAAFWSVSKSRFESRLTRKDY